MPHQSSTRIEEEKEKKKKKISGSRRKKKKKERRKRGARDFPQLLFEKKKIKGVDPLYSYRNERRSTNFLQKRKRT